MKFIVWSETSRRYKLLRYSIGKTHTFWGNKLCGRKDHETQLAKFCLWRKQEKSNLIQIHIKIAESIIFERVYVLMIIYIKFLLCVEMGKSKHTNIYTVQMAERKSFPFVCTWANFNVYPKQTHVMPYQLQPDNR